MLLLLVLADDTPIVQALVHLAISTADGSAADGCAERQTLLQLQAAVAEMLPPSDRGEQQQLLLGQARMHRCSLLHPVAC
jgi:hypothetical protein